MIDCGLGLQHGRAFVITFVYRRNASGRHRRHQHRTGAEESVEAGVERFARIADHRQRIAYVHVIGISQRHRRQILAVDLDDCHILAVLVDRIAVGFNFADITFSVAQQHVQAHLFNLDRAGFVELLQLSEYLLLFVRGQVAAGAFRFGIKHRFGHQRRGDLDAPLNCLGIFFIRQLRYVSVGDQIAVGPIEKATAPKAWRYAPWAERGFELDIDQHHAGLQLEIAPVVGREQRCSRKTGRRLKRENGDKADDQCLPCAAPIRCRGAFAWSSRFLCCGHCESVAVQIEHANLLIHVFPAVQLQ